MSEPLVSIVTPMYNAKSWLPGLFESVRSQTFERYEHIVVDDVSTDGGAEAAERLAGADPRVRILRMARNQGPAAARNLAVGAARGRYLAFIDADDLWQPTKLARQVDCMQRHGHVMTYHDYRHISHDGSKVGALVSGPERLTVSTLHTRRGTGCLAVMIDRRQVPHFFFPELARSLPEDFLAWLGLLREGHVGIRLAEDLGRYRLTDESRSSNKLAAARAVWNLYRGVERLPLPTAAWWWLQYAWNASRLAKRAKPT